MDDNHTLPWQGAYWALLAVALNTMSRPTGRVNGMPAAWTFYLRVGPVFCALDLVNTLGTFVYFVWRHRSIRYAALRVETQRRYDTPDEFEGRPEKLKENAFLRLVLFVLGVLPQVIKIFSCSGIVWVQVLCAIYFSSFFLDEAITALAGLARSAESRVSVMDSEIFFPRGWKNTPLLCDYGLVEGILWTILFNVRLPVENWIGLLIVGVGVAFLTSDTSKPKNVAIFALVYSVVSRGYAFGLLAYAIVCGVFRRVFGPEVRVGAIPAVPFAGGGFLALHYAVDPGVRLWI